eukprot:3248345-Pleurochrysis_carterae.AAC.1
MAAKKKEKGNKSGTGDDEEEETVPTAEVENLKTEHAKELQRINSKLQDALVAMNFESVPEQHRRGDAGGGQGGRRGREQAAQAARRARCRDRETQRQ